jgi:hypothetical protein
LIGRRRKVKQADVLLSQNHQKATARALSPLGGGPYLSQEGKTFRVDRVEGETIYGRE